MNYCNRKGDIVQINNYYNPEGTFVLYVSVLYVYMLYVICLYVINIMFTYDKFLQNNTTDTDHLKKMNMEIIT